MADCERIQRTLDAAASEPTASDKLVSALLHAVGCADCRPGRDLGALVPHELAREAFDSFADALERGRPLTGESALSQLHVAECDDCGKAFGRVLAERSGATLEAETRSLDALVQVVTANFLSDDDPVIRRRARKMLELHKERGMSLSAETQAAVGRSIPSPKDYPRIALAATFGLRQGPMSSMARLIHELTPYLYEHKPHLYILEGSFRLILRCGLLRRYPDDLLHCVAPGHLGGLTDVGAALAGDSVVGLRGVFDGHGPEIASRLDLDWGIDCVVYLIDPLDATSTQAETLAIKRECAVTNTPFLDTYTSAVEFFGLLHAAAGASVPDNALAAELHEPFGYTRFPHDVLGLVAHDDNKPALLRFARDNPRFLERFRQRLGTETTAMLLNGTIPDRVVDPATTHACELLRDTQEGNAEGRYVEELARGRNGGNMQIAEAVAMGVCDSVILLEEPRPPGDIGVTHRLIEYNARLSNQPNRLNASGRQMLIHDPRTAAVWAELWEQFPDGYPGPVTLETTFREVLGVELVLARPREGQDCWTSIAKEAAWYLLSAIADRSANDPGHGRTRVTVSCGGAMRDVIDNIGGGGESHTVGEGGDNYAVATLLMQRIKDHQDRYTAAIKGCTEDYPQYKRRIEQLAHRRKLTLVAHPDDAELWSIGSVTVAPMVGHFGDAADDLVEATAVSAALAKTLRGEALPLKKSAFTPIKRAQPLPPELHKHWATTDIAIVTGHDLHDHVFRSGSPVPLAKGMVDDLRTQGAVGEIAGLYLTADGNLVVPRGLARNGMRLDHLTRVVDTGRGRASILVAGAETSDDDTPPPRTQTVLAAIKAGAVSAFVTDPVYANEVLRQHVRRRATMPLVGALDA
jgi:methylglyoxal synthase